MTDMFIIITIHTYIYIYNTPVALVPNLCFYPIICNGVCISKIVPVHLTEHRAMKAYWGSGDISPRINIGTSWR